MELRRRTHRALSASDALALDAITKRYGSVVALDAASLRVRPGTVHALLGENGAGKTTLMRVAYGLVRPDSGDVIVNGARARLGGARDAIAHGIGMVHQHFTLVPVMTVADNVALGGAGLLGTTEIATKIRALAERTGFALDPAARVETLPIGAQQRVEIVKALVRDARVLILDEPTAVLAPAESAELLRWLRAFADAGNAAVLITHKLREALSVADDVTVLRRGRTVLTGSASEFGPEALTRAMIGDEPASTSHTARVRGTPQPVGRAVFRVERLRLVDATGIERVRDATFAVGAGEIVGIAGIEGSGQRELLRALAGRMTPASGTLERPDVVGFIPEDRHHDAVLLDRDLSENVALRGAGARRGTIDWRAMATTTESLMRAFDVRAASPRVPMRALSGGNQQKLVVARELDAHDATDAALPHAIVAENPTRGLDVRATEAVHERLRAASADGAAVVLYSSDIDEVMQLASRVLVVHDGVLRDAPFDRDAIGRAMLGTG